MEAVNELTAQVRMYAVFMNVWRIIAIILFILVVVIVILVLKLMRTKSLATVESGQVSTERVA